MTTKENIAALYHRFLSNELSAGELETFLRMINDPEAEVTISSLMDGTWQEMFETKEAVVRPMYKRSWFRIAAAAVIICMATAVWLNLYKKDSVKPVANTETVTGNDIAAGKYKAKLTLADGSSIVLDSAAAGKLAQQGNTAVYNKDGQLIYNAKDEKAGEMVYNTLSTANGEFYSAVLADGSKVWLNAASSIRFPASFTGKERRVEITGEAYFEVAHDKNKKFIVASSGVNTEVLGTHFNVNSYADEAGISVTLLEGLVSVNTAQSKQSEIIKPGQQAKISPAAGDEITISKPELDEVISWKEGYFHFESADMKTILRQFARWYDIEVIYEGALSNEKFFSIINRNTPLSTVLKSLQANGVKFRIEGKKLFVQSS
jgi:ferric-dicitrate binding protein FerR (iron transport regulator)